MKIRNEKGFTLVEMLAAVAIMGILSGVVITGVTGSINKSHQEYCSSNEGMLVIAGRDYFNDHRSLLPSVVGEQNCVDLDTLEKENYIDPMTDYKENACNKKESKVCGLKVTGTSFYYAPYLSCGACITQNTRKENTSSPIITFIEDGGTNKKNQDIVVTMNISDSKNEITSYSYTVYQKTDGGDIPIKTVDWKEYKKDKKITIRLNQKGTYYIEGRAYNSIGRNTIRKSEKYVLEYTLDKDCGNQISVSAKYIPNYLTYGLGGQKDSLKVNTWFNGPLYLSISKKGAVESYDVYINKKRVVELGTESTKKLTYDEKQTSKYEVEVIGYNDQKQSCKTKTYIYYQDNTNPTCKMTSTHEGWTKEDVTITANCSDDDSYCPEPIVTNTIKEETNEEKTIAVYDKAGNKGECSIEVQIDKTPPTIPSGAIGDVNGSNTTGSIQTLASGSVDTGSGIKEYRHLIQDSKPSKEDFTSNIITFTRSCKTSYHAWAIAIDVAGNISDVADLGSTADGEDKYINYGECSVDCGKGKKTSEENTCALITGTDEVDCNSVCEANCNYRGEKPHNDLAWKNCSQHSYYHPKGTRYFYRYCVDSDGKVTRSKSTTEGGKGILVCGKNSCPLGTLDDDGYYVIKEDQAEKGILDFYVDDLGRSGKDKCD